MNGAQLYTLATSLNDGLAIEQTLFYTLLNIARINREMARPWRKLVKLDTSNTALPSDTYLTSKTIPSSFLRLSNHGTIRLFDGVNDFLNYSEVPFETWIEHKDDTNSFWFDHANMKFYLGGVTDKTYTIYIPYIGDSGDITSSTSWVFPSVFHPILAFDVVAMYKLGIDYDDINARQGDSNARTAEIIFKSIEKWDSELARQSVMNMDYARNDNLPWRSGRVETTS
jgi:hypothetical protein